MERRDPEQFERLMEQAAKRGADQALKQIGLGHETAGKDVADLIELLEAWRDAKRTLWRTALHWITVGILGLLAYGFYHKQ